MGSLCLGTKARVALLALALTLLGVLAAPTAALAAGGTTVKQGCLTFEVFNDYAVLKEYDGSQANVTIPSSVNGRPVTEIEEGSSFVNSPFRYKTQLRSVAIPGTISVIPSSAFFKCTNLQRVTMESGVKTIGYTCFEFCESLTSVSIPQSVNAIDGSCFNSCTSLETVSFPSSIKKIPSSCFYKCASLKSFTIPNGVTEIDSSAFRDCGSLTSMIIPASCSVIGSCAFYDCGNLKTVELLTPSVGMVNGSSWSSAFTNLAAGSVIYVQNNDVYDEVNRSYVITPSRTRVVNRHPSREMYRLYNPNSGEHFYTANEKERDHLKQVGWRYEGVGWNAPTSGNAVYRLYNANAGDHHYTTSKNERDTLVRQGWKYEGVGWYSGGSKPLYRQYNPNAVSGSHNYTTSKNENDQLVRVGWRAEGIGWYGV